MADYRAEARRAAKKYDLDPGVFERQIQQESGFDPDIRSPKGATGIAQIMPATARGWGVDPLDPIASLDAAAKNMAGYVKKYGGIENALRAYNAGPGAIEASKGYKETNDYVRIILGGKTPKSTPKSAPAAPTAAALQTLTSPAQTQTSTVTTGGQVPTLRTLAERVRPIVTGPALPDYVKRPPPLIAAPDRSDPQRLLRSRIAELGNVPQTTTESTVTTPQTPAAPQTSDDGAQTSSAPTSGAKGSKVLELIYNDGGKGFGIKNGQTVDGAGTFAAVWGGHANHVHAAAGPKTIVALGKYAQSLGLHVGENSHFGGNNPGSHVPGSNHNADKAIDVSAPMTPKGKAKMKTFAKYVADYNRTRNLPAAP